MKIIMVIEDVEDKATKKKIKGLTINFEENQQQQIVRRKSTGEETEISSAN